MIVDVRSGQLAGSVQLELYDNPQRLNVKAYIYALWVNPDFRESKVAAKLLEVAEQAALAKENSVYLKWCANEAAPWVLEWYLRRGYDVIMETDRAKLLKKDKP